MTTVLLVDDHELIRDGLTGIFSAQDDMEVLGAAESVTEAFAMLGEQLPDVIVTDLQLPDGTGLASCVGSVANPTRSVSWC